MADIGSTTRVGASTPDVEPSIAASGPTPAAPPTSGGLFWRRQVSVATADFGAFNQRFAPASYLLISPTPPIFGAFSPLAGAVSRLASVSVDVTDSDGFSTILVWAEYADGRKDLIYDGTSFSADFDSASSVTGTTTKSFVVVHDSPGYETDYTLKFLATDSLGATSTASSAYTLTDPPAPVVPDTTPPTIALVSPAEGSELARTDTVVINITDAGGFARIVLAVRYPNGDYEIAHDGDAFAPRYAGSSTRTAITDGYQYALRRAGGWPEAPTVVLPSVVDSSGNTP